MKIIVRIFNVIVCGVILVGCSDNRDIEEKISSLQSQPIKLCLDEMRCRNKYGDTVVVDSVKPRYRMVVYVDSSACSPYGNIENWPGVESVNRGCDGWIDICLKNYDCEKYLFVTDDLITKYVPYIKETLTNRSHFGSNKEFVIIITKEERDKIIEKL